MAKYLISNMWGGEPGNAPGVGHEFRLWLTGYTLAQYYNCIFVHDPFCGSHTQTWDGVGRLDIPVEQWESFLNFGNNELKITDLPSDIPIINLSKFPTGQPVSRWADIITSHQKSDILFKCPFNQFIQMDWNIYAHNRFKAKYWEQRTKQPVPSHFVSGKTSVAVHIRRCDVTPQRYPDRYLPNTYYKKVLEQIREVYPDAEIHIYSDAKTINEFSNLAQIPNIAFHLQTNIFETFQALVSADILVTGIGSFSILAAYISNGIKITTEWNNGWNNFPTEQHIVPVTKQGNLSVQLLVIEMKGKK